MDNIINYFHQKFYPDLPVEIVKDSIETNPAVTDKALSYFHDTYYKDMNMEDFMGNIESSNKKNGIYDSIKNMFIGKQKGPIKENEPIDAETYKLIQKHSKLEPTKEQSKTSYVDYLKSKPYFLSASQQWGAASANDMVNRQVQDVLKTPILYTQDMNSFEMVRFLRDPVNASYHADEDRILNYFNDPQVNIHELSHATDSNLRNLPNDIFIKDEVYDENGLYQDAKFKLNEKYEKDEKIQKELYQALQKKSGPYSNYYKDYYSRTNNYFTDPSEIRARVNTLREYLNQKKINYHNLSNEDFEAFVNSDIKKTGSPVRLEAQQDGDPFKKQEPEFQLRNYNELEEAIINQKYKDLKKRADMDDEDVNLNKMKSVLDVLKTYG